MSFRIEYDDDQMNVVDKIQQELKSIGIHVEFKDDELEHDGYMIYTIIKKDPP